MITFTTSIEEKKVSTLQGDENTGLLVFSKLGVRWTSFILAAVCAAATYLMVVISIDVWRDHSGDAKYVWMLSATGGLVFLTGFLYFIINALRTFSK